MVIMNKNDVVIKELLEQVEKQKNELGTKKRSSLITNGLFKSDNITININTVNDVDIILKVVANLIINRNAYYEACEVLNISTDEYKFKYGRYSYDEWITDFKSRIQIIEWNKRKKKLEITQAKLSKLMSEDARTASELDAIKAEMGIK